MRENLVGYLEHSVCELNAVLGHEGGHISRHIDMDGQRAWHLHSSTPVAGDWIAAINHTRER